MSQEFYLAETKPLDHDNSVDKGIQECLRISSGKSFITFAGAGSGKTYSLKQALDFLKAEYSEDFTRQGKQIAVVTFTNNAADEIKDRIEQNPIFAVSTIHSFCWSAIAGFNEDIRKWYLEKIPCDLKDIEENKKEIKDVKKDIIVTDKNIETLIDILFSPIMPVTIQEKIIGADRENIRFSWAGHHFVLNFEIYSQSCWIEGQDGQSTELLATLHLAIIKE